MTKPLTKGQFLWALRQARDKARKDSHWEINGILDFLSHNGFVSVDMKHAWAKQFGGYARQLIVEELTRLPDPLMVLALSELAWESYLETLKPAEAVAA